MKTVENLNKGEILLVSAKAVNGGKVSLEFAQIIENESNSNNSILGLLNESDDRFNKSKPRRAWMNSMPEDIKKYLGVDVSDLTEVGMEKELNILNPTIAGQELNIQINETTEPKGKQGEYLVKNFEQTAKRAGKDGEFILDKEGKYIYPIITIVQGPANHSIIKETTRPEKKSAIDQAIANA